MSAHDHEPFPDDGPAQAWEEALRRVIAVPGAHQPLTHIRQAIVVESAESTQDLAFRHGGSAPSGLLVAARTQTAGRGRLGRAWLDQPGAGIAVSVALRTEATDDAISIRAGVAAAEAIEAACGHRLSVGLKWPNDLDLDGRKVGGVLVERRDRLTVIGLGINVRHTALPPEVAARATSLRQAGFAVDRLEVVRQLLIHLDAVLGRSMESVAKDFRFRDRLTGERVTLRTATGLVTGTVRWVDPTRGLEVDLGGECAFFPAATTTIIPDAPQSPHLSNPTPAASEEVDTLPPTHASPSTIADA
ncbi:MAG: biotin--[acetyl-CoA-carboxylase] ligase [Planctomycetota bacterium]|nr:biotin--[acetyl-CoA-carboxylase] ligase [Planctomycetota bacterium]MDA1105709.1 biotin--[acetyl-CoA-carboxylase] ligase [Planctomycetota bacterium]